MDRAARTVGVDVGGTKVSVARLDGTRLSAPIEEPTERSGPEAFLDQIERLVRAAGPCTAVGIGLPSVVRMADGTGLSSPNVAAADGTPLRSVLASRLGVPVLVDNDANVAAVSEAWDDELRLTARSLACVTVGTGVGGGFAVDGKPFHGSRTSAFELGYVVVAADRWLGDAPTPALAGIEASAEDAEDHTPPWVLERWASGRALDRLARAAGFADGAAAARDARAGDPRAVEVFATFGPRLAIAVSTLITLLEPEVVAIGGGASRAGDVLLGPTVAATRTLLRPGLGTDTIVRTAVRGPHAGVRGAALLPRLHDPETA